MLPDVIPGDDNNTTSYQCDHIRCSCLPGRFERGNREASIFSCKTGAGCKFKGPVMNQLINAIFSDNYISWICDGDECLQDSQGSGYAQPMSYVPEQLPFGPIVIVHFIEAIQTKQHHIERGRSWSNCHFDFCSRVPNSDIGAIRLPEAEVSQLRVMAEYVPAALQFSDISPTLSMAVPILEGITGSVRPGQVLAIMGTSDAAKSTVLDILARKCTRGVVGSATLVDGREVSDADFGKVIGFMYQGDTDGHAHGV